MSDYFQILILKCRLVVLYPPRGSSNPVSRKCAKKFLICMVNFLHLFLLGRQKVRQRSKQSFPRQYWVPSYGLRVFSNHQSSTEYNTGLESVCSCQQPLVLFPSCTLEGGRIGSVELGPLMTEKEANDSFLGQQARGQKLLLYFLTTFYCDFFVVQF